MLTSVFAKTLRDLQRPLLGWSIGVAALVGVMAALWPSIEGIPNLEEFLASYPEAMRELFNVDAITTGVGFMNAELFSLLVPALFIIFAVGRGARLIAGEEESGTLDVLLVTPVSRLAVLIETAAALAVAVLALGAVLFAATVISSPLVGLQIGVADAASASLAVTLLGIEHGWLALSVGAAVGSRPVAIGAASTFAVAGYVLYVMSKLVAAVEPWGALSPFQQALEPGPLGAGLQASYVWMPLAALVFVAAAAVRFDRRDVAAA